MGLGAFSWEGRGWGFGAGCKAGDLTSAIRVLKITPLILAYKLLCVTEM